jgi:hypothetical protein
MKRCNFSATSSALPCTTRPLFGESFFWRLVNSISRGKTILLHILLAVASSPKTEVRTTKALSTISAAAVLATTFAIPAWAVPVTGRTAPEAQGSSAQNQVSPELIAKLQEASDEAAQVGRHGGIKNNPG